MTDALEESLSDVDVVVQGLAHMAAERCLKSLEVAADLHGVGTHIFPAVEGEEPHALTVTFTGEWPWSTPERYTYRLRVPSAPRAGGVIDRETALRMLATDKAIRALEPPSCALTACETKPVKGSPFCERHAFEDVVQ